MVSHLRRGSGSDGPGLLEELEEQCKSTRLRRGRLQQQFRRVDATRTQKPRPLPVPLPGPAGAPAEEQLHEYVPAPVAAPRGQAPAGQQAMDCNDRAAAVRQGNLERRNQIPPKGFQLVEIHRESLTRAPATTLPANPAQLTRIRRRFPAALAGALTGERRMVSVRWETLPHTGLPERLPLAARSATSRSGGVTARRLAPYSRQGFPRTWARLPAAYRVSQAHAAPSRVPCPES